MAECKAAKELTVVEYDAAESEREVEQRPNRRKVKIYLFRHAESTANERSDLIGGRAPTAILSTKGEYQAVKLGKHLKFCGTTFDEIYCSSSKRAIQTANIVLNEMGQTPNIVTSDELLEQCHGGWEGRVRKEVATPEVAAAQARNIWRYQPEGLNTDGLEAESPQQVEARMHRFVEQNILARRGVDDTPKTVAIFGHGLACKFFLRGVMQFNPLMSRKIRLDNTAITEVEYDTAKGSRGGWNVLRINDHAHLTEAAALVDKSQELPETPMNVPL